MRDRALARHIVITVVLALVLAFLVGLLLPSPAGLATFLVVLMLGLLTAL